MNFMEAFLEFVERVKETGIVDKLHGTLTENEAKCIWVDFCVNNSRLIERIEAWDKAFRRAKRSGKESYIFPASLDDIKDAEEVAICIHFLPLLTEEELFEDDSNLRTALQNLNNDFAVAIASLMDGRWICDIDAENIFIAISNNKREEYKGRFFGFVEEIKSTCVVDQLHETTTPKEFRSVLENSILRNAEFLQKVNVWEKELLESNLYPIFKDEKQVTDSEEIALCVSVLKDFNEWDLFEDWGILQNALYARNNQFAVAIADCMDEYCVRSILTEEIFEAIEKRKNMKDS